jgi:AbrB family looped-hinge helix DNA binding protein
MVLTIDKFGRMLIPKKARKALRLKEGMQIEFTIDEDAGTAKLKPKRKEKVDESYVTYSEGGWPMLAVDIDLPEDFDTVAFMKQTRQEYLDKKMGSSEVLH